MSTKRLTIFDTTLRDGEQAPGFSLRVDEKLTLARQLATLGVDVIEAGFPIASEADAESVRLVATHVRGPVDRRPCPLHAGRHRSRRLGARAGRAPPHPRLHRHLGPAPRAQAADVARGLPRCGRRRGPPRPPLHRRRAVLGGGRDAQRHGLPLPRRRRGDLGGLHDRQPAGHGRLLDAGRDRRRSSARSWRACRTRGTRSSARTATTTSGWPSPTRWPRSPPARRRSSARSTASASAPATRRSRRS